jgi:Family of unknown function (DUF5832)
MTESSIKTSHLVVDPNIPGQEFCVLAFVEAEDRIEQRALFENDIFLNEMMNEYIRASAIHMARDINAKLVKKFEDKIETLKKSRVKHHDVIAIEMKNIRKMMEINEEEFADRCAHLHNMEFDDLLAKKETFKVATNDRLEREFNAKFGNGTSVRGVKNCGTFPTVEMAAERADFLASSVEPNVNHFVTHSFQWVPFNPSPDSIQDNRYQNADLQELMRRRTENEKQRDKFFEERKREMIEKANEETSKKKQLELKESIKQKLRDKKKE